MQVLTLVAAAMLCTTANALELKGVKLGMTMEELQAAFPAGSEMPGKPRPGGMACLQSGNFCTVDVGSLAGISTVLQVSLRNGKVADAYAGRLSPADFERVVDALKAKFGPATTTSAGSVQNRMGGKFDDPSYTWKFPDGELLASKFMPGVPTLDISQVEISSTDWLADKEAKKRREANDL